MSILRIVSRVVGGYKELEDASNIPDITEDTFKSTGKFTKYITRVLFDITGG